VAGDGGQITGVAALTASQRLFHAAAEDEGADALLARAVERGRVRGLASIHLYASGDEPLRARHPFELVSEVLEMWKPLEGDLPPIEVPAGVTLRTFELADALAVHALLDEAYGGWFDQYVPQAHEDWLRWMTGDVEFDPNVWWLAEREGELVVSASASASSSRAGRVCGP
jgi:hypothetical protein